MTRQADDSEPLRPGENPVQRSPDDPLVAMVGGAPRTVEDLRVNGHSRLAGGQPETLSADARLFARRSREPSAETLDPVTEPQPAVDGSAGVDVPDGPADTEFLPTREKVLGERLAPAEPSRGPGRRLRAIAGMDESILDWVPEERARYTRLGAIIMNTGLLAGLSLITALSHVVQAPIVVILLVGMFWAFMVMSFDGWLIASTHGTLGAMKIWLFLPRIVVSVLLGAVIAEPLVLWAFAPAVNREVQSSRTHTLAVAVTQWTRCNPPTGVQPPGSACQDYILNITGGDSPVVAQQDLNGLKAQRDIVANRISGITAKLQQMDNLARDECNGRQGSGFSGVVGQGPNCDRDRAEADQFRRDSKLDQEEGALSNLDAKILTADNNLKTATGNYDSRVAQAIAQAKANQQQEQDGPIGLLEQSAALGRLSARSGFVLAAQWMLRLLLIALDCLPVLAKLIGGTTSYDRLVNAKLQMRKRMHAKDIESTEHRYAHQKRVVDDILNDEVRAGRARQSAAQRAEIENLVEELRARRRAVSK